MIAKALYSSASDEWETPPKFFAKLNAEFHFTLDACASDRNFKCPDYFTRYQNALRQIWKGTVFCNPPYGKDIGLWFAKAKMEAERGATVVVLAHARTDTRWWHNYVEGQAEVRFIKGRLKFLNEKGERVSSAPFPSAVIVYRPRSTQPPEP